MSFAVLDKSGAVLAEVPLFEDALRLARIHHAARYDRIVRQPDGAVLARVMRGDLKKLPPEGLPSLAATTPPTARYGRQAPPVPVGFTSRPAAGSAPLAPPPEVRPHASVTRLAPAGRKASVSPEPPAPAAELTPAPAARLEAPEVAPSEPPAAARVALEPCLEAPAAPPPAAPVPASPVDQVAEQLGAVGQTVDELVAVTGLERDTLKRALLALWDQGRALMIAGRWSRREVA